MIQPERSMVFPITDITKYGIGSIFNSGDGFIPGTTAEQVAGMVESCQAAALQTRLKISLSSLLKTSRRLKISKKQGSRWLLF